MIKEAKIFYEYQLQDSTTVVGRQDKEEIIDLMAAFAQEQASPKPLMSDICYDSVLGWERIRWDNFMVHLKTDQHTLYFQVYPIFDSLFLNDKDWQVSYVDKAEEMVLREDFEEGACLMKLEGSYCWRGVWEGRLYFTDEEYWGEEIEQLSRLYNDCIVPWCKNFIKERDPSDYYDF